MKKQTVWGLLLLCLLTAGLFAGCQAAEADAGEPKMHLYDPGEFFTNIKDSKKLLNSVLKIDITDEDMIAVLEERDYVAKDTIVRELRLVTEEELGADDLQSVLAENIRVALNQEFETEAFQKVYFTRFVYQ